MIGKSGDEKGGLVDKKMSTKPPKKNGRPTLRKRGRLTEAEKKQRATVAAFTWAMQEPFPVIS